MFTSLISASLVLGASLVSAGTPTWPAGVEGTGTQGVTNPTGGPVENTAVNQESMSRLLSLNAVDDWCLFAPPTPNTIGESEQEEVAWCTKPRNNARLIPDGVFTGISFLKTDFYVQVLASGDFTKLNILASDSGGGELDPHGAQGAGNPIGGNVTTTVTPNGAQLNVGEWMQFISTTSVCIRACTNANATYDAAHMCEHKLDEMGCEFVMPGNYQFQGKYESCDADVAYPPGWYPTATAADGTVQFSTFAQYFTGVYTDVHSTLVSYTVGTTVRPETAAFTPSSSNCKTVSSIANGLLSVSGGSTITGTGSVTFATGVTPVGGSTTATVTGTTSSTSGTGKAGTSSGTSSSAAGTGKAGSSSDSGKGGSGSTGSAANNNTAASGSSAARRSLSGFFPGAGALVGVTLASVTAVIAGAVIVL